MTYQLPLKVCLPPELDDKATNIHARMAVYFDNNIYNAPEDRDDDLLYQYLYHIIYMLANKNKYFVKWSDYDEFALYAATKLYMRYINPEHQLKHGRIKSVLNYVKCVIDRCKIDYQRETFASIIGTNSKGVPDGSANGFRDAWAESIQQGRYSEADVTSLVMDEMTHLPKVVRKVVAESPYRNDATMSHRLYMSVLISVLKCSTLSNSTAARLRRRGGGGADASAALGAYRLEREGCVTLWRLGPEYSNMVDLMVRKAMHGFADMVVGVRAGLQMSDDEVTSIIMSAYGNTCRDNKEDN